MIYTVTLNPSLDYVMHLNELSISGVNRSVKEEVYPGGKGITLLHKSIIAFASLANIMLSLTLEYP